jgi:tRNA (cytidine32/uridine32-2'-O)-methyltransferase
LHIPVRIVLVETSHPGNIGAAARAMKTMGLKDLALVSPKRFPSEEASARASGAADLLESAGVYECLEDAVADCGLVIGASARLRSVSCPVDDPRVCAKRIWTSLADTRAAIVFGPEQSGLTNRHMGLCERLVQIPTEADYGSLNVAMAVQIVCYELRMHRLGCERKIAAVDREAPPATAEELEGFHAHLERVLDDAGFFNPDHPRRLKLKLRRLFQRAQLDRNEVNILRGALTALDPTSRMYMRRRKTGQRDE